LQCETNVWGLRPGRAARSARHARRVGGWAAAREDAGCGRRALGGRWLVAGASCCERCGRRASPVRRCLVAGASCWERCGRRASPVRRRCQCKWAANAASSLMWAAPSTQRHPQIRAAPSTQRHPNNTAIPNNEPAFAPEAMLHRLRACLSSAKSRNPMSPVH